MGNSKINLCGKICPYPVVDIINSVDHMKQGETIVFLVDDPLAIKSVPEELEDFDDVSCSIDKQNRIWEITITK